MGDGTVQDLREGNRSPGKLGVQIRRNKKALCLFLQLEAPAGIQTGTRTENERTRIKAG